MGLSKSLRRRWKATEGDSAYTRIRIMFSDKKTRRNHEFNKFGRHLNEKDFKTGASNSTTEHSKSELSLIQSHFDFDWYKEKHNISDDASALNHYCKEGYDLSYSPNPALAEPAGIKLTSWGLEYLIRAGVNIGCRGGEILRPDDNDGLDPYKVQNYKQAKIAVVTAIFGEYDALMPVDHKWTINTDFFVFSDRKFRSLGGWQQLHTPYHHPDPRRKARFIKLNLPLFFEDYDWVIWVDGNVLICSDPQDIVKKVMSEDTDFSTYYHPLRDSIIAEAAACAQRRKEDPKELAQHLSRIHIADYRSTKGLFETMVMVLRPASPSVKSMFAKWWGLLSKGSKRDQLSLPIAMAETPNLNFKPIEKDVTRSVDFYRTRHKV